ncbi:cupin domain-containing protein, partial [Hydrogenophaga sp.]
MNFNDDFSQRATNFADTAIWQPSPLPGVERRLLDRVGDEVARATSVVRYAPGSRFDAHTHGGGEEILVLEGVFSDETGDHPAGTYLRNPPGTRHAPFSEPGCVLLVKLWQFAADDLTPLRINTLAEPWRQGLVPGLTVMPLHEHDGVSTALVRWAPNTQFN